MLVTLAGLGCGTAATITAEAREVKYGSTVSVYDVTLTDQNGMLVGSATMTFYCLKEPLDL